MYFTFVQMPIVRIELYHGGCFNFVPEMHYLGGQMKLYKGIDTDILGIADLDKVATNLGYRNVTCYYSKFPGDDFEEGISICSTDGDVMRMVNRMENEGHTVAQIYLEHRMDPLDSSQVDDPLLLLPEPTNDPQAQNDQTDPELTEVAVEMENSDYEEPNDSGSSENERLTDFEDSDEEGDYIDILKEAKNDKCDSKIMGEKGQSSKQVIQVEWDGECDSDYSGSEELWPPNASSDDECNTRCLEFNEEIDMKKPINLKVGLTFQSAVVFRKALKEYCIQKGYDYTYLQNEKWRVTAECKEKCGWRIHASLTQMQDAFRIKTFKSEHNCGKHYHNRRVTSSWIASKYWEYIRDDITWTCDALKEAIRRDYNVFVSKHKCYRAKHLAIKMIHGSELEQFKKLWSYCAAIRKWQPGSTIELLTEGHKFQRLYVCLEPCKRGFLEGCRPIIGIDGCHLKGSFGGQLLCAIGKDANDNMFPIAYAVVEQELNDSWTWFLTCLLKDIGQKTLTFISDQQKVNTMISKKNKN